jgi:predicted NUDIX family phosphoesterase
MYKKEQIVAVKTKILFNDSKNIPQGFFEVNNDFISLIMNNYEIVDRNSAEEDINYKQIIPYMVFKYENKIFCMNRGKSGGEKRLAEKYTIGIGGHINQDDIENCSNISEWGLREFHEEISYTGKLNMNTIGFINDDKTKVGQMHLGIFILINGDNSNIFIKDELESGTLMTIEECQKYYQNMEPWSQMIFKIFFQK